MSFRYRKFGTHGLAQVQVQAGANVQLSRVIPSPTSGNDHMPLDHKGVPSLYSYRVKEPQGQWSPSQWKSPAPFNRVGLRKVSVR